VTGLRILWARLCDPFARRRREAAFREEIEAHLEMGIENHIARGLSRKDATAAARREFGAVEPMKETYRDQRGLPWLDSWVQDARFAFRLLTRERAFALAAVTTLALGIGTTTTVFSIVNVMAFRGLPVDNADNVVELSIRDRNARTVAGHRVSFAVFESWRDRAKTLAGVAAFHVRRSTIRDDRGDAGRVRATHISVNAFRLLGDAPIRGRDFREADAEPAAEPVVVIGHRLWSNRYGSAEDVIGHRLIVDGEPSTIVGVMAKGVRFPGHTDLWRVLSAQPTESSSLRVFGRLASSASLGQAQAELEGLRASSDHAAHPHERRATAHLFTGAFRGEPMFIALVGAMAFVLLIACGNVACLLLARASRRAQEIRIRHYLGGTWWRLIRQLLIESSLVAVTAGVLGFAGSVLGLKLFANAISAIDLPYWLIWTIDVRVFTFAALISILSVFLFGLAPALHISRAGGSQASMSKNRRWMDGLIASELALALTLLASAGFMMKSFVALYRADHIVDTEKLGTYRVALPEDRYDSPQARRAFTRSLDRRLSDAASVDAVGFASSLPFAGAPWREASVGGRGPAFKASVVAISDHYFDTLGVAVLQGRAFGPVDGTPGHASTIVNQRFAELWLADDSIGQRLDVNGVSTTIIGVAPTVRQQFNQELDPVIYVPFRSEPSATAAWFVRATSSLESVSALIRSEVTALDPELPVFGAITMEELSRQSRWMHRVFGAVFTSFALVALVLASLGLSAVVAYAVRQQLTDFAVRRAFGARPRDISILLARRVVPLLAVGCGVGLIGALGVGRLLQGLLVQTTPTDIGALSAVTAVLVAAGALACWLPTREALHVDPATSLREE